MPTVKRVLENVKDYYSPSSSNRPTKEFPLPSSSSISMIQNALYETENVDRGTCFLLLPFILIIATNVAEIYHSICLSKGILLIVHVIKLRINVKVVEVLEGHIH